MKLTTNFSLSEFACKDGTPVPEKYMANVKELAENLQVLRDYIGKPIKINSSYRHEAYNSSIGGSKRSQHLTASASDIVVPGVKPSEVHGIIEELIKDGRMKQGGLGKYSTFTHYDCRGYKARWNG